MVFLTGFLGLAVVSRRSCLVFSSYIYFHGGISLTLRRFGIAGAASALLLASGVTTVGFAGTGDTAVAADQLQAQPLITEAPDSGEARLQSKLTGHSVEDLSQRDEFSRVLANPDGSWTAQTHPEPVWVKSDDGEWHDVDTHLVRRGDVLVPKYAVADVALPADQSRTFATLSQGDSTIEWSWGEQLPEPIVDGPTATYPDVIEGGDLQVTALATGFTYNFILREAPTEPLVLPVLVEGGDVRETAQGAIKVSTPDDDLSASAPQPVMWDSSDGVRDEPGNAATVDTTLSGASTDQTTINLKPNRDFLTDAATEYPVVVDPSFTTFASGDAWVQNRTYTTGQTSSPELRVGTNDGGTTRSRAFMHFDNGTARWEGKDPVGETRPEEFSLDDMCQFPNPRNTYYQCLAR